MNELIKAIALRKKYNSMKLKDFIKELEAHKGIKIPQDKIEWWTYTGLNNTDLLESIDDLMGLKIKAKVSPCKG